MYVCKIWTVNRVKRWKDKCYESFMEEKVQRKDGEEEQILSWQKSTKT